MELREDLILEKIMNFLYMLVISYGIKSLVIISGKQYEKENEK